jgi:hypothetical protein
MASSWFRFHNKRLLSYATASKKPFINVIHVTQDELTEIESSDPLDIEHEILSLGIESPCYVQFQPINSHGKEQGNYAEMRLLEDHKGFRKSNSGYLKKFG